LANTLIQRNFLSRLRSLIRDISEAIRGSEKDYTEGNISKAILLLSIPMVIEMIAESLFAIVDIFFVIQLGTDQAAIVGVTESLMTLVYAVGVGLSTATTAIIARRIGEKENKKAAVTAFHAILTAIVASLIFAIPGLLFSEKILGLMGAAPEAIVRGKYYTMIMLGGNVVIMLIFVMNAVFRSAGDAAISMRVLWLGNIINIILDPCLIFGLGPFPELGVAGAAVATTIGRGTAVLWQFYILFYGNKRVKIRVREIKLQIAEFLQIIKLSLGGIGQSLIATSSWIFLMWILARFGSQVIAGYTLAIRIIIFVLLPSWGMSNAGATLVGQNLGAKKPERAEKSVWIAGFANMIFLGTISIFLIIFSEPIMRLIAFKSDENVILIASKALQIISYGLIAYAMGMVMSQAFNGAGDTTTPTILNFIGFWIVEIPMSALMAFYFNFGYESIFYSIFISETILAIMSIILFRRGKWKLREV
jgi:putative MATE family efflux protein